MKTKDKHYALVVIGASMALALTACGEPAPVGFPQYVDASPHRVHATVVYCRDVTASYPDAYAHQADRLVADSLDTATSLDQDGVTAYVNLITVNSYQPESTVLTMSVPPLPAAPDPPQLTPTPLPSSSDPFAYGQRKAQVQAANTQAQHDYQEALKQLSAQLNDAQTHVRAQTEQLRSLRVTDTAQRTDILGCIDRASERFQGEQGIKLLVFASDMVGNTQENALPTPAPLPGVEVEVIYYYALNARAAAQCVAQWNTAFAKAGASQVRWYDTARSQTLSPLLSSQSGGQV